MRPAARSPRKKRGETLSSLAASDSKYFCSITPTSCAIVCTTWIAEIDYLSTGLLLALGNKRVREPVGRSRGSLRQRAVRPKLHVRGQTLRTSWR